MIRRLFIIGILFAVVLILLWSFFREVVFYSPVGGQKEKAAAMEEKAGEKALKGYLPAWGEEIYTKNLFDPLRGKEPPKPVLPPEGSEPSPPPPQRPEMKLKGIVTDSFGEFVAYVEIGDERAVPLRKGDKKGDIVVVDITSRTLNLTWLGQDVALSMEKIKTLKR